MTAFTFFTFAVSCRCPLCQQYECQQQASYYDSLSGWSGCIAKHNTAPNNIRAIEPTNGQVQWPVLSTIYPNTTGETIAANAEPVFIMPLAVPENFGAMSIGIAHIGPIVNSAQKKPALSARATMLMLFVMRT